MTEVSIEDPTIKIKPSAKLVDVILQKVIIKEKTTDGIVALKKAKKFEREKCVLSLEDIKFLRKYLKEHCKKDEEKVYIHKLLAGVEIILPKPKVIPRNPELEARVKKLQAQQNNRVYKRMIKDLSSQKVRQEDTIAFQIKEMDKQLIAVAQFVFSVICAFFFVFWGMDLIYSNLDVGFRLLLGIIAGLIVALAEIYFLAKKLNENYLIETQTKTEANKVHQD